MAEVRRTKRSRAASPPAPREREEELAPADLRDDDAERALARMFAVGVPLVGFAAALVLGSVAGLPPALLVLAGAALLGTIGFFWASLRTLSGDAPLPRGVAAHAVVSRAPAPERKREALRALKDLEFEHSIGKIDDADFLELQARYRSIAKTLMREIDAGLAPRRREAEQIVASYLEKRNLGRAKPDPEDADDVSPRAPAKVAVVASPRVDCPKCTVSNEPDAAFCKKCGSPLAKPAAAPEETPDAAV